MEQLEWNLYLCHTWKKKKHHNDPSAMQIAALYVDSPTKLQDEKKSVSNQCKSHHSWKKRRGVIYAAVEMQSHSRVKRLK